MARAGVKCYWDTSGNLVFTKPDGTAILSINTDGTVTFTGAATLASANLTVAVLPAAVTIGGIAYTFPPDNGDVGEQLQTDGSGVLTWEASGV